MALVQESLLDLLEPVQSTPEEQPLFTRAPEGTISLGPGFTPGEFTSSNQQEYLSGRWQALRQTALATRDAAVARSPRAQAWATSTMGLAAGRHYVETIAGTVASRERVARAGFEMSLGGAAVVSGPVMNRLWQNFQYQNAGADNRHSRDKRIREVGQQAKKIGHVLCKVT